MNEMITEQLKLIIDRIKNGNVENNTIEIVPTAPHDTDKKVFVCQSCKIECSRASSLTRHIKKCILAKINVIDDDNDELIKLGDVSTRQQKPSETAENDKNNKKELECQYCGITCKRSCNLIQHMNKCAKRNDLEAKIETLEENNKSLNTLVKKSMGTFKYVNSHYPNAPNIAKLTHNQMNQLLLDNVSHGEIVDALVLKYEFNKLDTFLGDLIVESYKTKEPSDQSLWSSDVVRLSYIVKTLIDKQSQWIVDKKGVHVLEYVIQPLLTYIEKNYLAKYLAESYANEDLSKECMRKSGKINKIQGLIWDGILEKDILKYISPMFSLIPENKQITLDEKAN